MMKQLNPLHDLQIIIGKIISIQIRLSYLIQMTHHRLNLAMYPQVLVVLEERQMMIIISSFTHRSNLLFEQ